MSTFTTVLLVVYLLAALAIIGLVLLQQGKGADMGASFGSGASNTVFGASGSGNFLTRMTAVFATIFLIVCLTLGNMYTNKSESKWINPVQEPSAQNAVAGVESSLPTEEVAVGTEIPE